MKRLE